MGFNLAFKGLKTYTVTMKKPRMNGDKPSASITQTV
jgi:hypothetical protein